MRKCYCVLTNALVHELCTLRASSHYTKVVIKLAQTAVYDSITLGQLVPPKAPHKEYPGMGTSMDSRSLWVAK